MHTTIGYKLEMPLSHLQAYTYKYNRTEEPDDKKFWESLIITILQALSMVLDSVDIKALSKELTLETLKDIDQSLSLMEREWDLPDGDNDRYSVPVREAMNKLYNSLEDLSISISMYIDEEKSNLLERMENGDFTDFKPYKVME